MALTNQNKKKVKKVIKGLNKASKLHAGQAKVLKGMTGKSKRLKNEEDKTSTKSYKSSLQTYS